MERGRLVVVAGPSGVGKTSLVAALLDRRPELVLSTSTTTRPRREGETDGVEYRFLTDEAFRRLEGDGAFLESAIVHGHRYGTPRAPVEQAIAQGRTMVLEIDVQGARQIRRAMPDAVLVFVEPPSVDELVRRLTARGTESDEAVRTRLRNAREELLAAPEFDHQVVNDDLDEAVEDLTRILDGPTPAGNEENT